MLTIRAIRALPKSQPDDLVKQLLEDQRQLIQTVLGITDLQLYSSAQFLFSPVQGAASPASLCVFILTSFPAARH